MDWIKSYWGKARPGMAAAQTWHPLVWHSLDVAAAMQALLAVRPAWVRILAQLNDLPQAEVCKRLVLVASFHDLGKFADNFQSKVPDLYQSLKGAVAHPLERTGHGVIGAELWNEWQSPVRAQLKEWANAAFSHHGVPVAASGEMCWPNVTSNTSRVHADEFLHAVTGLIGTPEGGRAKHGSWLVAGLVILADWIGSNQSWFPYEPATHDLDGYWRLAQDRANRAVDEATLAEAVAAHGLELEALLGAKALPTPLQDWSARQSPKGGGHLYIIEDLTGAGKTEAALLLAHRLMQGGAAEGLYWGLPTMATANGLYARLQDRYRGLFEGASDPREVPSLILSHSASDIHQSYQASIAHNGRGAGFGDHHNEQEIVAEAYCSDFFAEDRKKALLAQIGVGTLDQALLGVLPVRHQSLRLAALARRVLVIDEAHSFDAYTGRLMEALLRFHYAHGGSAIVLTATLTQSLRQNLMNAYEACFTEGELSSAFPLITHVHKGQVEEVAVASVRGGRRDLPVRCLGNVEAVQAYLLSQVSQGQCGVYIRNTVEDARAAYEALKASAPEGVDVHLFHSRYTLADRARIEADMLSRFGAQSGPEQRRGQLLVATQVVESSLDIDFDVMATDLCPIDLLMQRSGRLQRHSHRPARAQPELIVLAPELDKGLDENWYGRLFPKGQYVYPDLGQVWRTLKVMDQHGGLNLKTQTPRDYLEPVFSELGIETPQALLDPSDKVEGRRIAERGQASTNALQPGRFQNILGEWGADVLTPTRLGEQTRTIRMARWINGALIPWSDDPDIERAWRLSEIQIETRKIAEAAYPDATLERAVLEIQAQWGRRYAPPIIVPLQEDVANNIWYGDYRGANESIKTLHYSQDLGLRL